MRFVRYAQRVAASVFALTAVLPVLWTALGTAGVICLGAEGLLVREERASARSTSDALNRLLRRQFRGLKRRRFWRMSKLAELEDQYQWVGEALAKAHSEGKIDADGVRWHIEESTELEQLPPVYWGRAQAFRYIGLGTPELQTIAQYHDLSIPLLEQADEATLIPMLCKTLAVRHGIAV